jgi:hypothetical protein
MARTCFRCRPVPVEQQDGRESQRHLRGLQQLQQQAQGRKRRPLIIAIHKL